MNAMIRISWTDLDAPPQRNLNNAFAYDLVPSPSVLVAALKAARRVNDYPTAVRVFEGRLHIYPSSSASMLPVELYLGQLS